MSLRALAKQSRVLSSTCPPRSIYWWATLRFAHPTAETHQRLREETTLLIAATGVGLIILAVHYQRTGLFFVRGSDYYRASNMMERFEQPLRSKLYP